MKKLLILISALFAVSHSAKILGVFPTMAKSHFIVGSALMKGLAERGHDVSVISPFPQKTPLKNYRDIDTPGVIEATKVLMDSIIDMSNQGIFDSLINLFGMGLKLTNLTFQEPEVQKLLNSKEQFDLVIMEVFVNEAHLGFGYRFNAPIIGVGTFGASLWTCEMVGSPSPPSYVPSPFLGFTDRMTLIERIGNLLVTFFEKMYYDNFYFPKQIDIYNQYFREPKKPTLYEIRNNVSLVLLNSHFSLGLPRPYLPNMIEVGGMHVNRKTNKLPNDILKFIESAKDGVVYFSMGSNLKSKLLPIEKRNAILNTFRSLKQKVLWKWEDKELPGKPDNVFISDWFPQDDILAHPNVKIFITHGGLLSTTEAIYHGVPIIGIPMFGDQPLNMARATKAGFGLTVEYKSLTEKSLKEALTKILNSDKYSRNIKDFSARYRDQPMTPLDTAIYWVEYVIRHKGASHIKSASQNLSFIQYHNIDALSIIFGIIFLILYLIYAMIMKCLCMGRKKPLPTKSVSQKKKRN